MALNYTFNNISVCFRGLGFGLVWFGLVGVGWVFKGRLNSKYLST